MKLQDHLLRFLFAIKAKAVTTKQDVINVHCVSDMYSKPFSFFQTWGRYKCKQVSIGHEAVRRCINDRDSLTITCLLINNPINHQASFF